jgi:integrase
MLRRSFKSATTRAKLSPSFRQHDLRHRWVTIRANAGEPMPDVQYEAGHAQIATTMLYYKQSPVHLRRPLTDTLTGDGLARASWRTRLEPLESSGFSL